MLQQRDHGHPAAETNGAKTEKHQHQIPKAEGSLGDRIGSWCHEGQGISLREQELNLCGDHMPGLDAPQGGHLRLQ